MAGIEDLRLEISSPSLGDFMDVDNPAEMGNKWDVIQNLIQKNYEKLLDLRSQGHLDPDLTTSDLWTTAQNNIKRNILREDTPGINAPKFDFSREQEAAQGGRIGYAFGPGPVMDPRMAQAGLPGIPRMAPDGMEYDMSENGGFQPLGAKEGKDDVKANLAKNEFVFTADAVRGAGGGDIELGAQRMYDTMKNLERRMA